MEEYDGKRIIIGDFNLGLNTSIDRSSQNVKNNDKSAEIIKKYMEETYLSDIWRERNSESKMYTRITRKPKFSGGRIDFCLIDASLNAWSNCKILPSFKSDHDAILFELCHKQTLRGRGMWKLNVQMLFEIEYIELIKKQIKIINDSGKKMNAQDKWETMKLYVIGESQRYCENRAKNRKVILNQLEEKLEEYKKSEILSESDQNLYEKTKCDYEYCIQEKAMAAAFRAKVNWHNEAGKPSKYFLNLEKSRSGAKNINCLITDSGQTLKHETKSILNEQRQFFKKLYDKDENIEFQYKNETGIKASEESNCCMTEYFTMEELKNSIKSSKRNKAPGCDGLPIEFYVVFFNDIAEVLLAALNEAFKTERLHTSARRGIINLIPKKGLDTRYLKNARPISLLTSDYKLVEKMLANRIKPILNEIVNQDQKGFMSDRRISCNIRRILDIIEIMDEENEPGIIISIDFMKCFDKIDHAALKGAMRYFNIHENFVKWVSIIYKDAVACVTNNGFFSEYFDVKRSVRQGGPCSAYLFLIIAEVLAIELRKNDKIHGIWVREIMKMLGQYADDIDLYLKGEENVVNEVFKTFDRFNKNSGFEINYNKTTLYKIGSLKKSHSRWYTKRKLNENKESINVLGVEATHERHKLLDQNYKPLITKMSLILKRWKSRNIDLIAKITIINSLVASLFVYKMSVLPMLSQLLIDNINSIIVDFLWNSKSPKIALRTLQANKLDGGLNLTDFVTKDKALKASWVKIMKTDEFIENIAYDRLQIKINEKIWECNLSKKDIIDNFPNNFWRDVLLAWSEINYTNRSDTENKKQIENQIIWYNSNIKIAGNVFFWLTPFREGLLYLSQLIDATNGKMLPSKILQNMFNLSVMQCNSLKTAIPKSWIRYYEKNYDANVQTVSTYTEYVKKDKVASYYYKTANAKDTVIKENLIKWDAAMPFETEFCEYESAVVNTSRLKCHSKYRSLHYRLLNNALIFNDKLYKWKIKKSNLCSNCNEVKETTAHFFLECSHAKKVMSWVIEMCKKISNVEQLNVNDKSIMLNTINPNVNHIFNYILLVTKSLMYSNRCLGKITVRKELEKIIENCRKYELYYAKQNNKMSNFLSKWVIQVENRIAYNGTDQSDEYVLQYIQQMKTNTI